MQDLTIYQDNFNSAFYKGEFNWFVAADRFLIGLSLSYTTNIGGREIYIESRGQMSGETLWVVKMESWVLGKDNKYHYEPTTSSRTTEFINNTRFKTKEEALVALITHEREFNGANPPLTI